MNKKLCTIFFPSRGRLDLVENLLKSIEKNTFNKEWIEVISICDQDDKETIDLFAKLSKEVTYDFYFICRKKKEELHLPNDYYSLCLKLKSKSYFTWGIGNDTEIITKDWDFNLYEGIKNTIPDLFDNIDNNKNYYYLIINDNSHWNSTGNINKNNHQSCCFPILSGNLCDDSNETVPSEYPGWIGDIVLYDLMEKSPKCYIINALDLIEIKHVSHHNGTYKKDEVADRVQSATYSNIHHYHYDFNTLQKIYDKRKYLH